MADLSPALARYIEIISASDGLSQDELQTRDANDLRAEIEVSAMELLAEPDELHCACLYFNEPPERWARVAAHILCVKQKLKMALPIPVLTRDVREHDVVWAMAQSVSAVTKANTRLVETHLREYFRRGGKVLLIVFTPPSEATEDEFNDENFDALESNLHGLEQLPDFSLSNALFIAPDLHLKSFWEQRWAER